MKRYFNTTNDGYHWWLGMYSKKQRAYIKVMAWYKKAGYIRLLGIKLKYKLEHKRKT